MKDAQSRDHLEQKVHELEARVKELGDRETLLSAEVNLRRRLVEQSRDAIVVVNEEAGVHEANLRFATMLGYTPEEVEHLHVWDWDLNLSRDQILELAATVDEKGQCLETRMRRKDGTTVDVELSNSGTMVGTRKLILCVCHDVSERNRAQREKGELIRDLQESLAEIKTLRGILPLCTFCKKVRDDTGYWEQVDIYLEKHSAADISHGLCPECLEKHYPEEIRNKHNKD